MVEESHVQSYRSSLRRFAGAERGSRLQGLIPVPPSTRCAIGANSSSAHGLAEIGAVVTLL